MLTPSTALVTLTSLLAVYWFMSYRRPRGVPPGPLRIPFLGTIAFSGDSHEIMQELNQLKKQYGNIFSFYIGNKLTIVLNSYDLIKEAFVTKGIHCAGRPMDPRSAATNPDYPRIKGIIDGSYSEEWKRQRHTALSILRNLGWGKSTVQDKIREESLIMISCLKSSEKKPYDPAELTGVSVANIICSLLFGKRYPYGDEEFKELLDTVARLLKGLMGDTDAVFIPILQIMPSYKKGMKKLFLDGGKLVGFCKKKIQEGKSKLEEGEEPKDFVTHYLAEIKDENAKINEDWLLQHILDFFIAGAETTATTLKWAFLYMSLNINVQSQVQAEIDSVFGTDTREFTIADREKLPYTDATISEIQRLACITPSSLPHQTTADIELGGYTIPKGAEILGNLYEVLHDPDYWSEPEEFRPERFLSASGKETVFRDHLIPFSMGRRTCLGEQLAKQELFIFFTSILHSFVISIPEGQPKPSTKPLLEFVYKPRPYKLQFCYRL